MNGVLLDTHAIIWIVEGMPIAPKARREIDKTLRLGQVFVSAISAWEMAQLATRRRITLPMTDGWLDRLLLRTGFSALPLTPECAVKAALLPAIHRDPADRLLIATAQVNDLVLITRDAAMLAYAEAGHCGAIAC